MWNRILRRFFFIIPQLLAFSLLVFALAQWMPGDPLTGLIIPGMDQSGVDAILDNPWYIRYLQWIANMLRGDFGLSYTYRMPVGVLVGARLGNTLLLAMASLLLSYLIAVPLGIYAGRFNGSLGDKVIRFLNSISFALPIFMVALLLVWLFGFQLELFPTRGMPLLPETQSVFASLWNRLHHLALPALAFALSASAGNIQRLRSGIIEAKQEDYVLTARSKGVPESMVYRRHIFRNASMPVTSLLGYDITGFIGSSIFIEYIFSYPGIGRLFISSLESRDFSVIVALLLFYGLAALIGTLVSDIILTIVDPRVRVR
ncbi:peptide/nickel transport system permease protein [Trichococcus patagoniensis]|uniref:Peptide/nickel transport system permease protein n=1 Tax=Trichococcus patagoniensis TaxID=382641 RepID=A0A2T5IAE3_9LACT|nr:ABC transporter permease [Trichococcus patagoniensis]PTQ80799.1 peptide/nickel transport system permease protein [Trichococcus patagoniensis]